MKGRRVLLNQGPKPIAARADNSLTGLCMPAVRDAAVYVENKFYSGTGGRNSSPVRYGAPNQHRGQQLWDAPGRIRWPAAAATGPCLPDGPATASDTADLASARIFATGLNSAKADQYILIIAEVPHRPSDQTPHLSAGPEKRRERSDSPLPVLVSTLVSLTV